MKKSRITETQIDSIMKEADACRPAVRICDCPSGIDRAGHFGKYPAILNRSACGGARFRNKDSFTVPQLKDRDPGKRVRARLSTDLPIAHPHALCLSADWAALPSPIRN